MAKAKRPAKKTEPVCCDYHYIGKKKMMIGLMLFIFGGIIYMGYEWYEALMAVGALMFFKGICYMRK